MLQGLRTVIYKVPDLKKAKDWYSQVFSIVPYFDEPFYVGYNVCGYELGLDPDMTNVQPGNGVNTYWGIKDIKLTIKDLRDKYDVLVLEDPYHVGGCIWVATIADPFGNTIGLIENPEFKTGF